MTGPERRPAGWVRRGAGAAGPRRVWVPSVLGRAAVRHPAPGVGNPRGAGTCPARCSARQGEASLPFFVPLNVEHIFIALHSVLLNRFKRTESTLDLFPDPKAAPCTCIMRTVGRHCGVLPGRSVFRYGLLPAKWVFVPVCNL